MGGAGVVRSPARGDVRGFVKRRFLAPAENRIPVQERLDNENKNHGGKNARNAGIEALVENEALCRGDSLSGNLSSRNLRGQGFRIGKETDARTGTEDFLVARRHGD